ncbi:hypothetical protein [Gynurincola endophyticus]|jgi:hypothetical protein|uniref:hypothetical protein n=1 Tax=Gynurincola endophyticus TaxID=2479004 RepID=UPI000F8EFAFC|nr:hypothetical protein [Gynurincola endophyticus]
MKKLLNNVASVNFIFLLAALVLTSEVKANDEKAKSSTVELKYIGQLNNNPVVEVVFNGKKEELYTIGFRDQNGVLFYSEKVKIANGSKKFALNAEELNLVELTIEVKNRKNKNEEVFAIQNSKSVIEETVVVKVK